MTKLYTEEIEARVRALEDKIFHVCLDYSQSEIELALADFFAFMMNQHPKNVRGELIGLWVTTVRRILEAYENHEKRRPGGEAGDRDGADLPNSREQH